ncbi:polyamine aminopropyltransferase [Rubeoparvulum massiliense]|uniref:polyamine aminopropyltransferase n=1 Tax=Rubeoparvulum massiliense TaxID=1631346 RepID=UPI00065E6CA7|nr:polyamine aminopropyltransferase [Rubeoparvulum massiliense]
MIPPYLQQIDGVWWLVEDDRDNLKVSYRIKNVIFSETSSFQHVMILDSYDFGRMLVLDGAVQTTALDGYIYNEMIAHIPLLFHPDPKNVLVIGGGDCGVVRELAKYPELETIDMVEIDQIVVNAALNHLPEVSGNIKDPRLQFHFTDGVQFVKEKKDAYDVVIIDSSDPVGPAEQLFTSEFYQNVYQSLRKDGVMVCQSESPILYAPIMERCYNSIREIFASAHLYTATVPTYPGGLWSFTLGLKQSGGIQQRRQLATPTRYINRGIVESAFHLPEFLHRGGQTPMMLMR